MTKFLSILLLSFLLNFQILADISLEQKEYLGQVCGAEVFNKWKPIDMIKWASSPPDQKIDPTAVYQVCDKHQNCNYILKIVNKNEAEFSEKMSAKSIAPLHFDSYICEGKIGLVTEKLDGDLTKLLPSSKEFADVIPQVLDLVYRSMVDEKVCQGDVKPDNFYFKNNHDVKIYLGDYGAAKDCPEYKNLEEVKKALSDELTYFNNSLILRLAATKREELPNFLEDYLKRANEALRKDERWSAIFADFKELVPASLMSLFSKK